MPSGVQLECFQCLADLGENSQVRRHCQQEEHAAVPDPVQGLVMGAWVFRKGRSVAGALRAGLGVDVTVRRGNPVLGLATTGSAYFFTQPRSANWGLNNISARQYTSGATIDRVESQKHSQRVSCPSMSPLSHHSFPIQLKAASSIAVLMLLFIILYCGFGIAFYMAFGQVRHILPPAENHTLSPAFVLKALGRMWKTSERSTRPSCPSSAPCSAISISLVSGPPTR